LFESGKECAVRLRGDLATAFVLAAGIGVNVLVVSTIDDPTAAVLFGG